MISAGLIKFTTKSTRFTKTTKSTRFTKASQSGGCWRSVF